MWLYMGNGLALATYRRGQQIRALADCAIICGATYRRFMEQLELKPDDQTCERLALGIESTRDCQELSSLAALLMGRRSELSSLALAPCAEACRRCAQACDALSMYDGAAECADLCRRAEEICRQASSR